MSNWKDDLKNNLGIGSFDFNSLIVYDIKHEDPYLMFFNPKRYKLKSPYSFIILKIKISGIGSVKCYTIRDDRTKSDVEKDSGNRYIIGDMKTLNFRLFHLLPDISIMDYKEKRMIEKIMKKNDK